MSSSSDDVSVIVIPVSSIERERKDMFLREIVSALFLGWTTTKIFSELENDTIVAPYHPV
jgi:hypothetical protein